MATSLNDIIIMTFNIIAAAQEECALHIVQTPTHRTWNLTLTHDPTTTNNDSYLFLKEHLPRKDTQLPKLGNLVLFVRI